MVEDILKDPWLSPLPPAPQPGGALFCCMPGDALWSLSPVASSLHRYFKFTILGFKT